MSTFCDDCGHGSHGVQHGLNADECAEPWCTCGERAREAAWTEQQKTKA